MLVYVGQAEGRGWRGAVLWRIMLVLALVLLMLGQVALVMMRAGVARVPIHLVLGIVRGREEVEARRQRALLWVDVVDDVHAAGRGRGRGPGRRRGGARR